jgi:NhaC family Na+:H+ antiporter
LIIIILSLCKVKINISILISIISAAILAILFQNKLLKEVIHSIIFGFQANDTDPLRSIIKGGGIISMLKPSLAVFVSCSIAGIFEGIKVFDRFKNILISKQLKRHKLFGVTSIVSIVTAAFGCNPSGISVLSAFRDLYSFDAASSGVHQSTKGVSSVLHTPASGSENFFRVSG